MKPFVVALLLALLIVLGWSAVHAILTKCVSPDVGCLFGPDTWIFKYQTLISGILALGAAGVVYWQTTVQAGIERERLSAAEKAADDQRNEEISQKRNRTLGVFFELDLALRDFLGGVITNEPSTVEYAVAEMRQATRQMAHIHYAFATWLHIHVQRAEIAYAKASSTPVVDQRQKAIAILHVDILAKYIKNFEQDLVGDVGQVMRRPLDGEEFRKRAATAGYPEKHLAFYHYFH